MTIEAAGSAASCLVPMKTPRAMTAVGKWGQGWRSRESGESIKIKDNANQTVVLALIPTQHTYHQLRHACPDPLKSIGTSLIEVQENVLYFLRLQVLPGQIILSVLFIALPAAVTTVLDT